MKAHNTKNETNGLNCHPAVSVVMPCCNAEPYVGEAVASILAQTYSDFELIAVDDGSTDRTVEVLRSYGDPRLRVEAGVPHAGNYPCRNRGARLARGRYIAVMDADDMAEPDRLAVQVDYMERHSSVWVCGSDFRFVGGGVYEKPKEYRRLKVWLLYNNMFLHPSLLIRRSAWEAVGGYNECYTYSADYDLMCRMALRGEVVNLPEVLIRYRVHVAQISTARHQEQVRFADAIRANYLRLCGFAFDEASYTVFNRVMNHHEVSDEEATQMGALLERLERENGRVGCFDPQELREFCEAIVKNLR